jgi:hypothetical protein
MAVERNVPRVDGPDLSRPQLEPTRGDGREIRIQDGQALGNLFRQLVDESGELIRQEANLAKLEVKQAASAMGKDAAKIGVGVGLAAVGGLCLTAFLVIGLGVLLGGAYWASALIVGGLFLIVGGVMANRAMKDMQRQNLKPEATIDTLKDDAAWAKHEAKDFKRELLS